MFGSGRIIRFPRLSLDGQKALIKHRRDPEASQKTKPVAEGEPTAVPDPDWSEAKSPTAWAKKLGMSLTTLHRHIKAKKLIVDKITTKLWRIRLDLLERYLGGK